MHTHHGLMIGGISVLTKLSYEDWIHAVPDTVGEQIHIHHCKTGRGNDKLYIKRIDNGAVAYCHHCGERGYASNRVLGTSTFKGISSYKSPAIAGQYDSSAYSSGGNLSVEGSTGTDTGPSSKLYYPIDARNQVRHWTSNEAKIWILQYGLTMDVIDSAGICWSDKFSSILFPRYLDGNLVAFQARRFPNEGGPKYVTYGDSASLYDALRGSTSVDTLVLVEDYLSGLKVSQIAPAFVLNGTGLKDTQLTYLLKDYSKFVIMLDNDNWQVKTSQFKLLKRISTFAKKANIVEVTKDPKEYELAELKTLLQDYIT